MSWVRNLLAEPDPLKVDYCQTGDHYLYPSGNLKGFLVATCYPVTRFQLQAFLIDKFFFELDADPV